MALWDSVEILTLKKRISTDLIREYEKPALCRFFLFHYSQPIGFVLYICPGSPFKPLKPI